MFILKYGVLRIGLPTAISVAIMRALQGADLASGDIPWLRLANELLWKLLLLMPLLGYSSGALMWRLGWRGDEDAGIPPRQD